MSIVGRNTVDIGFTREKVDLFRLSCEGAKATAGAYYALAGQLSPNVQQADYYIVCGTDKRLWELRCAVGPKLNAGQNMSVRLVRSTDGGETFAPLGPAALAMSGDTAAKRFAAQQFTPPIALSDKDLIAVLITTSFEINHGFSVAVILD